MSLDLKTKAQRRTRALLITAGALLLVLVALFAVAYAMSSGDGSKDDNGGGTSAGASKPAPSPSVTYDDGTGYQDPDQWVKLPKGSRTTGSYKLEQGFPHTPEGAAAMVAASVRNQWTMDPARMKAGIRAYAVKDVQAESIKAVPQGITGIRQEVGVPARGDVPKGATLAAWPIGVQWTAQDADTVNLFILTRVSSSPSSDKKQTTQLVVNPAQAVWESGDWKTKPAAPAQDVPDPADIGSAEFSKYGWKAIQEGERR